MKLLLRITLWLAVALTVLLAIWAVCFYFATIDEINDETDDSLIDYSDGLIIRKLAGVQLPSDDNGTNNTYYIKEVPEEYALSREWISFEDQEVFISSKAEFESARVLTRLFRDSEDRFFELTVAVPTFEKDDIERSILWWIVALYILMLLSVLFISVWVVSYNMRPLKAMLRWLEEYNPGKTMPPVPSDTNVTEFRHLADTIRNAAERFDVQYLEQKRFIGNASHELQTPLAACSNRIEMLLDSPDLTENQAGELIKVHRELQALITLNRTLLLLTKIENGQFPETSEINFRDLVSDSVEMFRTSSLPSSWSGTLSRTPSSIPLPARQFPSAWILPAFPSQIPATSLSTTPRSFPASIMDTLPVKAPQAWAWPSFIQSAAATASPFPIVSMVHGTFFP